MHRELFDYSEVLIGVYATRLTRSRPLLGSITTIFIPNLTTSSPRQVVFYLIKDLEVDNPESWKQFASWMTLNTPLNCPIDLLVLQAISFSETQIAGVNCVSNLIRLNTIRCTWNIHWLCNWLSVRCLMSWINHLPPVCVSTFWKSTFE